MHPLKKQPRLTLLLTLIALLGSSQAGAITGGRAYSILVNVPTLGVTNVLVSDTGSLPPTGGFLTSEVLNATVTGPPILFIPIAEADVATDTTMAGGVQSHSVSLTTGLDVLPNNAARVTATVVRSEANSSCVWNYGFSTIVALTFGGLPVTVTGEPNQVVGIPGVATLTINEQIHFIDSNTASLTVNALHLRLLTGDEVIVAHAESLVDQCAAPLPAVTSTWSGVKARTH